MISSVRRATAAGTLAAALTFAAFLGAAPAQAHDALASTSPTDGQSITTNPGKVSITLNNPPNTQLKGSNIIKVTAPDGHVVSSGEPSVDGATLTTKAEIDHPGKHTVAWRAVSADGHPIEGTFTFTYAGTEDHASSAAATTSPATPSAAASAASTPETAATSPVTQAAEPAVQTETNNTGWLIGAGVVILAIAALVYVLTRRGKANAK
ncbi:copper resistance CopC family protein [Arthrobacter sp. ZGTC131]|uniref:copper resistance CopC family protein n=1 Tax=Arthrobacter sp. ZGTC131 TaxID=2058898 RepID=UPI000CE3B1AE|nr:copper resistance CopC family protein [Arthrobacter sp. ZGTC131]